MVLGINMLDITMKYLKNLVIIFFVTLCSCTNSQSQLSVLQYNTWSEGKLVPGGGKSIIQTIQKLAPDIVLFQEVRGQKFIDGVIDSLKRRGLDYYGKSLNISTAFMSRYPIDSVRSSIELGEDSYAFVKANVTIKGTEFVFYSIHLDWKHLSYFNIKGIDGHANDRIRKVEPWTDIQQILAENDLSRRPMEVKTILTDAMKEINKNRIVILGGDFNEPSFLDWQESTKDLHNHNRLVVDWTISKMMIDAGFKDCYRTLYPNPVTHAGFTHTAGNKDADPSKLSWSEGVDDRERIDLNYFYPDKRLELVKVNIVGPQQDFYNRKLQPKDSEDEIITPVDVWASDHKAILSVYNVRTDKSN